MSIKQIPLKNFKIADPKKLTLISGPCVIESLDDALHAAEHLKKLCEKLDISLIYKSSFDKANRSSIDSYRGPGLEEGLKILQKVKESFDLPVFTDIHEPHQAKPAGEVCDVLQIPAFLSRQTDLLVEAGKTKKVINIKKGQFMAPWDMKNTIAKIESTGNTSIILTDRGTSFGYNNLVTDLRGIPIMQKFGYPVCFDGTHSVQLPGGLGDISGGQREFIPTLSKAAVAAGCDLLYMESHPNPKSAKCDSMSMIAFDDFEQLLTKLKHLYLFTKQS